MEYKLIKSRSKRNKQTSISRNFQNQSFNLNRSQSCNKTYGNKIPQIDLKRNYNHKRKFLESNAQRISSQVTVYTNSNLSSSIRQFQPKDQGASEIQWNKLKQTLSNSLGDPSQQDFNIKVLTQKLMQSEKNMDYFSCSYISYNLSKIFQKLQKPFKGINWLLKAKKFLKQSKLQKDQDVRAVLHINILCRLSKLQAIARNYKQALENSLKAQQLANRCKGSMKLNYKVSKYTQQIYQTLNAKDSSGKRNGKSLNQIRQSSSSGSSQQISEDNSKIQDKQMPNNTINPSPETEKQQSSLNKLKQQDHIIITHSQNTLSLSQSTNGSQSNNLDNQKKQEQNQTQSRHINNVSHIVYQHNENEAKEEKNNEKFIFRVRSFFQKRKDKGSVQISQESNQDGSHDNSNSKRIDSKSRVRRQSCKSDQIEEGNHCRNISQEQKELILKRQSVLQFTLMEEQEMKQHTEIWQKPRQGTLKFQDNGNLYVQLLKDYRYIRKQKYIIKIFKSNKHLYCIVKSSSHRFHTSWLIDDMLKQVGIRFPIYQIFNDSVIIGHQVQLNKITEDIFLNPQKNRNYLMRSNKFVGKKSYQVYAFQDRRNFVFILYNNSTRMDTKTIGISQQKAFKISKIEPKFQIAMLNFIIKQMLYIDDEGCPYIKYNVRPIDLDILAKKIQRAYRFWKNKQSLLDQKVYKQVVLQTWRRYNKLMYRVKVFDCKYYYQISFLGTFHELQLYLNLSVIKQCERQKRENIFLKDILPTLQIIKNQDGNHTISGYKYFQIPEEELVNYGLKTKFLWRFQQGFPIDEKQLDTFEDSQSESSMNHTMRNILQPKTLLEQDQIISNYQCHTTLIYDSTRYLIKVIYLKKHQELELKLDLGLELIRQSEEELKEFLKHLKIKKLMGVKILNLKFKN